MVKLVLGKEVEKKALRGSDRPPSVSSRAVRLIATPPFSDSPDAANPLE